MPYLVEIPILGGITEGKNLTDAIAMAADYIGTFSLDKANMPPSFSTLPAHEENDHVRLISVNISGYRRNHDGNRLLSSAE